MKLVIDIPEDVLKRTVFYREFRNLNDCVTTIKALEKAVPLSKGKWIIVDDCERFIAKCSECGRIEDSRMINKYPYCRCGAKMGAEE